MAEKRTQPLGLARAREARLRARETEQLAANIQRIATAIDRVAASLESMVGTHTRIVALRCPKSVDGGAG